MLKGNEVVTLKREVWLHSPPQPPLAAVITGLEADLFWTNLPRETNQVLVLLEKQNVRIGVSLQKGFYTAESKVIALGRDKKMFYGLAIPGSFSKSQERQFVRTPYSTNVFFKAEKLIAQTALVNFSAGGVMVYLVPQLEKVIQSGEPIYMYLDLDEVPLQLPVRMSWRKTYDDIPFAGFEFQNVTPALRETLSEMASRYAE